MAASAWFTSALDNSPSSKYASKLLTCGYASYRLIHSSYWDYYLDLFLECLLNGNYFLVLHSRYRYFMVSPPYRNPLRSHLPYSSVRPVDSTFLRCIIQKLLFKP